MAVLIDIPMPKCCGECPCFYANYPMHCQAVKIDKNKKVKSPYREGLPSWCPIINKKKNEKAERIIKQKSNVPYKAFDIACYIISKCDEKGYPISNLDLNNLLFFIQKQYQLVHKKAFTEEISFDAAGAKVESVYSEFCCFGGRRIRKMFFFKEQKPEIAELDKLLIDAAIQRFVTVSGSFETISLINMVKNSKEWKESFSRF